MINESVDKSIYSVNVGNIGTIYCTDKKEAEETFDEYVRQSKLSSGRASGEPVTLIKDGEPIKGHGFW